MSGEKKMREFTKSETIMKLFPMEDIEHVCKETGCTHKLASLALNRENGIREDAINFIKSGIEPRCFRVYTFTPNIGERGVSDALGRFGYDHYVVLLEEETKSLNNTNKVSQ